CYAGCPVDADRTSSSSSELSGAAPASGTHITWRAIGARCASGVTAPSTAAGRRASTATADNELRAASADIGRSSATGAATGAAAPTVESSGYRLDEIAHGVGTLTANVDP